MASENVGKDSKRRNPAARLLIVRKDEDVPSIGHSAVGELNRAAASVIMTVMFAARWARADLLRAIGFLASNLHEWGETQDRRLFRLMCYVNNTLQLRLIAFIGDKPEDLKLVAYSDADFAGDRRDSKSTSGAFMALWGKNSFFPVIRSVEEAGVRISLNVESRSGRVEWNREDDADPVTRSLGNNTTEEGIAHCVRG